MKKTLRLALLLTMAALLTACHASNHLVPKTVFSLTGADGKQVHLEAPKDLKADRISFTQSNGVSVVIEKIDVRTNPEVINAAGAAQAEAITKLTDLAVKLLEALEKGAVKAVVPVP